MRARLLALTLVPLVGMTAFAFLWTSDRYERAGGAQAQLETTRIATELADLSVDVDIENDVAAAAGPNSKSLASVGFVRDARVEITTLRANLDQHAAEIDKLADRKGSWARVTAKLDALEHDRTRAGSEASHSNRIGDSGKQTVDQQEMLRQIGRNVAAGATTDTTGSAALDAIHELTVRIGYASDESGSTLATMVRATELDQESIEEVLIIVGHASSGTWKGAAAEIAPLGEAQENEVETLSALATRRQATKLMALFEGPFGARWKAIRVRRSPPTRRARPARASRRSALPPSPGCRT